MVETHIPTLESDQDALIQTFLAYPTCTPHLNAYGLTIRSTRSAGRGVFATRAIDPDVVIEISPVLLFPPAEYEQHGSKTQLDGYTFVWKKTSEGKAVMALALGLGSLFNHEKHRPNVKWVLDHDTHSIRYTTVRRVEEGEELTISYGVGRMWWEPEPSDHMKRSDEQERRQRQDPDFEAMQLGRIGISDDDDDDDDEEEEEQNQVEDSQQRQCQSVMVGNKTVTVANGIQVRSVAGPSKSTRSFPPIYRLTAGIDPATLPLKTCDAWIIDIAPTSASWAVKFLQKHAQTLQTRDDGLHSTRHLRSFRTTTTSSSAQNGGKSVRTQLLLCLCSAMRDRGALVAWLRTEGAAVFGEHPEPYVGKVPVIAAPTKERLAEWQSVWPCIVRTSAKELLPGSGNAPVLMVDRAAEERMWTQEQGRLRWAVNRFKRVVALARHAKAQGNSIGSAVHVTHPYDTACKFVSCQQQGGGGGGWLSWEERESRCDWSQLTGDGAPLVGRINASWGSKSVEEGEDLHSNLNDEKAKVLCTLSMSEAEWTSFNATNTSLYTSATPGIGTIEVDALDSRLLLRNPLKHAVISAISRISALRTLDRSSSSTALATNGSDYLLTTLTLFTLFEPCIYCAMALVHSRVAEVYFLLPSPGRGACCGANLPHPFKPHTSAADDGGILAIQEQKGLNHNFTAWRYMANDLDGLSLQSLQAEFDIGILDP